VGDLDGGLRVELGSILNVSSSEILDVTGAPTSQLYQVLRINQKDDLLYSIKARLYQQPVDTNEFDFVIDESKEDYDLSTDFAPVAGNYSILIPAGVTIGQVSNEVAFTTGSQAAGVSFDFVNRGRILGRGGDGGDGGTVIVPNPSDLQTSEWDNGDPGIVGGDAFEATVPVTIDNGSGFIFAGGGGAGGNVSFASSFGSTSAFAGFGGSGGQGYIGGVGGNGGLARVDGVQTDNGEDGNPGSLGAPGVLGDFSGGAFGESGDDGAISEDGGSPEGTGGLSGFAIKSNGNPVTITSGDTALNIKGRRDF
jgi:hypothetical protein